MKDPLDFWVLCKKNNHGAKLYHNPNGGCIKSRKGGPAVPFSGGQDSRSAAHFLYWVVAVCKREDCTKFNKPVFLSEDDFRSLTPPCCCNQKMIPERDMDGKGDYLYRCEICQKSIMLAELLPVWKEVP